MDQKIIHGDCLEVLKTMADVSVDAVVTDPPYGYRFMGKRWDYDVPSVEIWSECLRVLKPGGHLLAFAGTRTQHRMAVRIEDAGFEIRDMIAWVYGSGFPKSLDVSKSIDKAAGNIRATDYKPNFLNNTFGNGLGGGKHLSASEPPITDAARQWQGWGTALKPSLEPVTVARKPIIGTVAANVLEWGAGALNVDASRIESGDNLNGGAYSNGKKDLSSATSYATGVSAGEFVQPTGRWPANLIHDGSDEVVGLFPVTGKSNVRRSEDHDAVGVTFTLGITGITSRGHNDNGGSAARFFYCSKASKRDRDEGLDGHTGAIVHEDKWSTKDRRSGEPRNPRPREPEERKNYHPTVKPTDLMRYLCRLVTPPGGIVLDPFAGSGSTGKAAALEGFGFIGIEREAEYVEIARARIAHAVESAKNVQSDLFN